VIPACCCCCCFVVVLSVHAHDDHAHDHEEEEDGEDYTSVTFGSAVKLVHKQSKFRLHSHQIKYGSGSGQQSVTGFQGADDPNSLWQVKEPANRQKSEVFAPGTPVKCGQQIRLQHATTKKWLHSHLHASPLTQRQEISGYGDDNGGGSDTGDNWVVECAAGATLWMRDAPIAFQHVDTGKRLYTRRQDGFDNNNCRGCPIVGQLEISAHSVASSDANALWVTEDGIYFPLAQTDE
jgi:hypothetical protein